MKNKTIKLNSVVLIIWLIFWVGARGALSASEPEEISLRPLPEKIYGITLDSVDEPSEIVDAIQSLSKMPMSRIVFDKWRPASDYKLPASQIYQKSFVMGELLDSYYFAAYNLSQYKARTRDYLKVLGSKVDLWEVGNEINGEWLGRTSDVVAKMTAAFDIVKARGGRTALTLYYNPNCWAKPSHEMFKWTNTNVPNRIKGGLDYVFVSYYEEDCNNFQPDWTSVMTQVSAMFPNSKVGIGECGTRDESKKEGLLKQYYSMNLTIPSFVGGYFWWYFNQDMVPKSKPLWGVLNQVISTQPR